MQIILLEKVVNLGNLGDVVKVKDGYARNFLIPQRMAKRATPAAMAVTVRIPTSLRTLTQGRAELTAEAATVGALLDALEPANPGLKERVLDAKGVRRFINVYVNDEDVRFLDGLGTALEDGDAVTIVPAIAGGA